MDAVDESADTVNATDAVDMSVNVADTSLDTVDMTIEAMDATVVWRRLSKFLWCKQIENGTIGKQIHHGTIQGHFVLDMFKDTLPWI